MSPCDSSAADGDVPLRGARRQPGGRPDALDVEDHARHFGVVGQAGELAHQRDARARGRGHRARAGPAGAEHHADRGDLVLGLDDRVGRLARGLVDAMLLHVPDQRFGQRRRRRDRIPGDDGDAGEHRAERAGGVPLDQDLAVGLVHALDRERILLRQVLLRVLGAGLERAHVQVGRLHLLAELLARRLLHLAHVDAEQLREHAVVDHVLDQAAQLGVGADAGDDLVERHRVEGEVVAQRRSA